MRRGAALALVVPLLLAAGKPASKAPRAPDPKQATEWTVRPGETLGHIARKVEVPRVLIIEANALKAPFAVRAGQKLVIPRRRERVVKAGETGFSIAYDLGVPWSEIARANGLDPKAKVRTGQKLVLPTLSKPAAAAAVRETEEEARAQAARALAKEAPVKFAWPLGGEVRRGFTPRDLPRAHDGIDIPAPAGTAVRAAAPGRVVYAGLEPRSYGQVVILDHGKGWFSAYGKLAKVTVNKGERARAGERVGLVGNTGSTPQTELHFEVRRKTVPLDPLLVLPDQDNSQKTEPVSR